MSFFGLNLFGDAPKQESTEDMAKGWKKTLKKEARRIDSDIRKLENEDKKAMKECKKLSSKGHPEAARHLAKQVVSTRKAVTRLYTSKAQLNSIEDNLQIQISMLKMQNILGTSAEIMHAMNDLCKLPEMKNTMSDMQKEMLKAGLIETIMTDAMDMMEPDELEDEANAEVDKLMAELTSETLTADTAASTSKPIVTSKPVTAGNNTKLPGEEQDNGTIMDENELTKIQARLDAL